MTAYEYKAEMRRIMERVISEPENMAFSDEESRILKHCYDEGYIKGLVCLEMVSGRVAIEIQHGAEYTLKGLEFLDELAASEQPTKNSSHAADTVSFLESLFAVLSHLGAFGNAIIKLLQRMS